MSEHQRDNGPTEETLLAYVDQRLKDQTENQFMISGVRVLG